MTIALVSPSRLRAHGMLGMNCRNVRYINRYNQRSLYPLVDNKLKTKLLAQDYELPTPPLRFVVREQHQIADIQEQLAASNDTQLNSLTKRELQIFTLLASGQSASQISESMYISPKTVHAHRANILNKLGLDKTADIIHLGIRHGIVDP